MRTLTTRTLRTVADFPGVIARRDNNGNADDADFADCRGFAGRDARRGNKGNAAGF